MANEWIDILITYDGMEALIVKGALESEGIQVVENSLKISPFPVNMGKMGEVKLLVRKEDHQRATEILKTMEEASEEEPNDY